MSTSASSSSTPFPQYRVKRKAPPTIDIAEKYPSPDPQDPFAPLWELRNRTSSALGQNPIATKDTSAPYSNLPTRTHQGPLGKSDTFKTNSALNSIPIERRRSNPYVSPHSKPTTTYGMPPRSGSTVPHNGHKIVPGLNRLPSQTGSTAIGGGLSHPPLKPSQVNSDSTRSNAMSRTDKERNNPHLVHPQPRALGDITRRPAVDNSSSNETESDLSIPAPADRKQWVDVKVKSIDVESQGKTDNAALTTTISFDVGVDVKPALLQRVASNGTTSTGSASLARNAPPQQQSRLAKFWLPKKASHDGYIADGEKRGGKLNSKSHQKGPVHKLSISAPLKDTFVQRSRSQQSKDDDSSARNPGRSRGGYTSDTDFEENTGGIRLRGVLFRTRKKASIDDTPASIPESANAITPNPAVVAEKSERPDGKVDIEYTPVTNPRGSYPTPAPSPQLKPIELQPEAPLEDERKAEEKIKLENGNNGSTAEVQAPRVRKFKAPKTPGSAATTVIHHPPSTSIPPSNSNTTSSTPNPPPPPPKLFKRRTSSTTPATAEGAPAASSPLDPAQLPSTHSISNTSIVHVSLISVPRPNEPLNGNEDAGAFVKPRRAPRPPAAVGIVEGIQSEPEPLMRNRFDDLRKGIKQDKKQSRKDKQDGESALKSRTKSEDENLAPKRQNMDAAVKEVSEADTKLTSRPPISVVRHGKAASTDLGTRKDNSGVGGTEGSDDVFKKATVPVSVSTPARLSSKKSGGGCLPQSQPLRGIFHPKGASPDNSFNSSTVPSTEYNLPTRTQLSQAASLPVYAEDGRKYLFGSLFEKQKTVVIFIRHFWCPLCQDYMSVVKSTVTPDMIVADGWMTAGGERDEDEVVWKNETRRGGSNTPVEKIGFVVISNGAYGMIAKYRQIFSLPFRVYTDPSLGIYKLLGMGKTRTDCQELQHSHPTQYLSDAPGPSMPKKKKHNYSLRKKADTSASSLSDKEQGGGYVKHGFMGGIAMVVARAIKVGMPVWEKGGDAGQLGGEFVLGPGLICTYAHKMQSSKGHAPIEEVLHAANVKLSTAGLAPRPTLPETQLPSNLKQESAQKQAGSVDLSSPPKPPREYRHAQEPVRTRKESLTQEIVPSTGKTISHPHHRGPSQRADRERRNEQPPNSISNSVTGYKAIPPALPPALKAVMTREEEARWVEERQKGLERVIQERGHNVRKVGALGRSTTSQGQGGAVVRSTQATGSQPVTVREGRGNATMTESRSAPIRSSEEEERIVYKAEGRRVPERTRGYGSGSGYAQRGSIARVGHSAAVSRR